MFIPVMWRKNHFLLRNFYDTNTDPMKITFASLCLFSIFALASHARGSDTIVQQLIYKQVDTDTKGLGKLTGIFHPCTTSGQVCLPPFFSSAQMTG
jgi:hypothetical protein